MPHFAMALIRAHLFDEASKLSAQFPPHFASDLVSGHHALPAVIANVLTVMACPIAMLVLSNVASIVVVPCAPIRDWAQSA